MRIVVPFKSENPKSRLAKILSRKEREEFAKLMLLDLLDVLKSFDYDIKIISPAKIDLDIDVKISIDKRSLDECINDELKNIPVAVIMSDLPLLNEDVLNRFFNTKGDVVIAPGRRGGTNMLLVRRSGFRVSYHYGSFLRHIGIARDLGFDYAVFDSFYASVDMDSEEDLLELMLHGKNKRSATFLKNLGFSVLFEKEPRLIRNF